MSKIEWVDIIRIKKYLEELKQIYKNEDGNYRESEITELDYLISELNKI